VALLVGIATDLALGQSGGSGAAFEAASIQPFPEGSPIPFSGCQGGPGSSDPGVIDCRYVSLNMLLMQAYGVRNREISGPGWLDSIHFNILAKLPGGTTREQVHEMYRNLLATRFGVALHHEKRMMTTYTLTIAKNGPRLKESDPGAAKADDPPTGGKLPIGDDGFPILRRSTIAGGVVTLYRNGRARLSAGNVKLAKLAEALSGQLDQAVTDETGLTGNYDIALYWTPDSTQPGGRPATDLPQEADAPEASLFAAIEQQLGLRLETKKTERDILAIDRAEKTPREN